MANMLDYVAWRGDLSFVDDKFNEVDAAIFSMLSYIDYSAVCREETELLRDAAQGYCPDKNYDGVRLGLIIPSKNINKLFCDCGQSNRFGCVKISDFKSKTCAEEICQFAAVTFHLPRSRMVITFRGTDDSIVGWREDFCLSYLDSIPAQRMALEYVEQMAEKYPDERIYVCGHSKGGNLSAYATVNCRSETRRRILKAYSCDGPGFDKKAVKSAQFRRAKKKLDFIVPQSSFIGTMFEVGGEYTVVNSVRRGAYQHDIFSWEVQGRSFCHLDSLSERGLKNCNQFRASMERMTAEEKKDFAETFFSIVESTGADTLTDFTSGGLRKLATAVHNYNGLDKHKKEIMVGLLIKLFDLKRSKSE